LVALAAACAGVIGFLAFVVFFLVEAFSAAVFLAAGFFAAGFLATREISVILKLCQRLEGQNTKKGC
jgi:hypothetical protein